MLRRVALRLPDLGVFPRASDSGAVGLSCPPVAGEVCASSRDRAYVARRETELAQGSTFWQLQKCASFASRISNHRDVCNAIANSGTRTQTIATRNLRREDRHESERKEDG